MATDRVSTGVAILLAALVSGCATSPTNYAATLSTKDPKWRSKQCEQIRATALAFEAKEKETRKLAPGLLLGPYGIGIALAIKEHQDKQRKQIARDMHMQCSSQPLPKELQAVSS
ncbi:hypothetical protein [Mesorhizobium sp. 1M-11]|uniref:hypothetical protein n=1 Tax=Mesorhizobium sp. 1M-11 TaxID=1529006 RepID=UPI0006C75018|nr:hypothetical protein [Mesorhizobium sp. 1M-11]